jgi:hypothetical protein
MGIRNIGAGAAVAITALAIAAVAGCASTPGSAATAAPASRAAFNAARVQWQKGATAISADQGKYWTKAAADLTAGAATDGGDTSGYAVAATALAELTSLPDAMQSPAQNAAYHADIDALNTFFHTPGLYG